MVLSNSMSCSSAEPRAHRGSSRGRGATLGWVCAALLSFAALAGCKHGAPPAAEPSTPQPVTSVPSEPEPGPVCGRITCAAGEICCNASCNICTPPDGMCTQQVCEEDTGGAPTGQGGASPPPGSGSPVSGVVNGEPPVDEGAMTCANVRCMAGTHCEMVQVTCVRAPCNPVPECKPDVAAGGVACGKNTCGPGQTCCNASCGICTDPGKGCIKMFCQDGQMPSGR
jgi:hypothetical protein